MCIISTAQQARPKVRGQSDPCKSLGFEFPQKFNPQLKLTCLPSPVDQVIHPGQCPFNFVLLEVDFEGRVAMTFNSVRNAGALKAEASRKKSEL